MYYLWVLMISTWRFSEIKNHGAVNKSGDDDNMEALKSAMKIDRFQVGHLSQFKVTLYLEQEHQIKAFIRF